MNSFLNSFKKLFFKNFAEHSSVKEYFSMFLNVYIKMVMMGILKFSYPNISKSHSTQLNMNQK